MNMMEITAQMRENKKIEFKDQLKIVILLSVPAILEQLVGTAMSYIDTAMLLMKTRLIQTLQFLHLRM